jgi:hypothetical protein
MAVKRRRRNTSFPFKLAQLGFASMEVIARRTLLMAGGTCSPAEYRRMVQEKIAAASASGTRLLTSGGQASAAALISPWHRKAMSNVKRLRKL